MSKKYDFCGWATKNNLKCADGRTIVKDAFKDCDGLTVPLVWMHMHDEPSNVIGHALLENRKDGVYTYGSFNNTEKGIECKELVAHGDITKLSIFANKLVQKGGDVLHGIIREVSLVYSGANPGAVIENPILAHSDDDEEDLTAAVIYTGEDISLMHSDDGDENIDDEDLDSDEEDDEVDEVKEKKTPEEIFDSMNEEQQELVSALVGMALNDENDEDEEDDQYIDDEETDDDNDEEDNPEMKHNMFDANSNGGELKHVDIEGFAKAVFADTKKLGSFRDAFMMHADTYGLKAHPTSPYGVEIDALFPDPKALNNEPDWIKRDTEWVSAFMGAVRHTPFSRVKMLHADLTDDEARARGYYKTKLKKEEVFTLLKRSVDPQTIYKKQKMDRDDVVDITSFDVVAWLRKEMRMMLEEEIARACLISDGRSPASEDKISEDHVKSIMNDAELYTITVNVDMTGMTTDDEKTKAIIKNIIKARKQYKGSGNPIFFTTEDQLTDMLLLEDGIGHDLYPTVERLATKLRVSRVVTVPVMEGVKTKNDKDLVGIIVNPRDYTIGADKGGAITAFDDFDIDYNQMKYLIETRLSGALTKPFSAMVIEKTTA